MPRTTDDPQPKPWKPLGERVPTPPQRQVEWEPTGTPGIERNRLTGHLRTNLPLPK